MNTAMKTPPIVSAQEWAAAHQQLLAKEKELTRAHDALAAMRRRMPWTAVDSEYEFDGPEGKVNLLGLFGGRRQLIVYRAFYGPEIDGWPDRGCRSDGALTFAWARRSPVRPCAGRHRGLPGP